MQTSSIGRIGRAARRLALGLAATTIGLGLGVAGQVASTSIPRADAQTPAPNPPTPPKCGLTIALVFDVSVSVTPAQLVDMRLAANTMVTELTGTPSSIGIYTFATWAPATTTATSNAPAVNLSLNATPVTLATGPNSAATVHSRINGIVVPTAPPGATSAGFTNWQQGLLQTTAANAGVHYDKVLFITDGTPTANGGPITGTTVSTSPAPTAATPRPADLDAGINAANALKAQGTRVVAVGVAGATTTTLQQISGPVQNSDWFLTSFAGLGSALHQAAAESCEGTLTVVKQIQTVHGQRVPRAGWSFSASATSPAGASTSPASGVTNGGGAINFQVLGTASTTTLQLSEVQQPGFQLLPQAGQNAVCTADGAPRPVTNLAPPVGLFSVSVGHNDVVSCTVVNQQVPAHLTLLKHVVNLPNSGNAQPTDWTLRANGPGATTTSNISGPSGDPHVTNASVEPGTYSLSEAGGPPGFTAAAAWACTGAAGHTATTVTVAAGQSATCTLTNSENPVVRLVQNKTVDLASALDGDTLNYTLTVANQGTGPSGAFTATDTLPPTGVTFVSADTHGVGTATQAGGVVTWAIPNLAAGTTATLTIRVTVAVAVPGPGPVPLLNRFQAHAPPGSLPTEVENPCPDNAAQSCATTEVFPTVARPSLVLSKTVDLSFAHPGDTLVYTIEVLNNGNRAEGFTARDMLPAGVTFVSATTTLGTFNPATLIWTVPNPPGLALHEHALLHITVRVNPGTEATTQLNRVTLTAAADTNITANPDTKCPGGASNEACATTTIPGVPHLVQSKTVDMTTAAAGARLTYTVTIRNAGTAAATNVVATDTLPVDVSFVSADAHGAGSAVQVAGQITWRIPSVAIGQTVTLTVVVTVGSQAEATTLQNGFHIQQPPGGGLDITVENACPDNAVLSCAQTAVPGVPQLTQSKAVDQLEASVGATLTYTVTATNVGSGPSTGTLAHDTLAAGATFVRAAPSQGTFDPATGIWTVGTVAPGQTVTLTLVVTVDPGAEGTTLVNRVTFSGPPGSAPPVVADPCVDQPTASCASTDILGTPHLVQSKTVDKASAVVGDTITYTITVANQGTGDATSVTVHDILPVGLGFVSADTAGQSTFDPTTGLWVVPIPAGTTDTLTLVMTVLPSASGRSLQNVVVVDPPPGSDPTTVNDPCPFDPTQSCAVTDVALVTPAVTAPQPAPEAVHPNQIVTDLGSPAGHGLFGSIPSSVVAGALLAAAGVAGLGLARRHRRR